MYQYSNAYEVYQNNQVNTLSSGRLLLMLYDGALKFLRFALAAMEEKDVENTNKYLVKTQDIISELMATLDFNAGEIANQLYSLYDFMIQELIDANIKKDAEKVRSVYSMIEDLRDTWDKVV
ncbi:MAG: flagellar export chaperone FliS [Clostridiales bacterium]|jgi:flagellar protein FliS|nr:flagellar export chaperone FliS [Clostridiales bacterium]